MLLRSLIAAVLFLTASSAPPRVGDTAPDFRLMDQHDQIVRSSETRGHKVVLVFYRGFW